MKRIILILNFAICYLTIFSQQIETFKDTRDGKVYETVKIGTQEWFAENLSYEASAGCWAYDNDMSNVTKYGYLYNWETAKNVCPTGWHLPSKAEFETLLNNVGGVENASYTSLIKAGNSGFSAQLGGWRYSDGDFGAVGLYASFWSSSSDNDEQAWGLDIYGVGSDAHMGSFDRPSGFSVRCLQDN